MAGTVSQLLGETTGIACARPGLKRHGWIFGGLLYGLSFPSHPFPSFGFLALVALVPTFLCVIEETSFARFFAKTFGAFFIGSSVAIWWVYPTDYLASLLGHAALATCLSVPFLLFFPARKWAGTGFALLLFPFIWAVWEWVFSYLPFCIPLLFFGHTQAVHPALMQYAAITGVWGVSFWLAGCNALLVASIRVLSTETASFDRRHLKFLALLLLLPPAYSLYAYFHPKGAPSGPAINVLLVQPNIDPHDTPAADPDGLGGLVGLTARGLASKPDLVVWPETAVPSPLFQFPPVRNFIANEVMAWDTPLLTGTFAVRQTPAKSPSDGKLRHKELHNHIHFNAAAMVTPELASYLGQGKYVEPKIYYKRKLFPFVEFVPFVNQMPFVAKLRLSLVALPYTLTLGERAETFVFKSRAGDKIRMGTLICFEEFYPGLGADLAQDGAQFIAIIGDEWLFHPETSHYFNMMVSGVRAIETGLPVVRNANNGYLAVTDQRGVTTRIPGAHVPEAIIAAIHPSSGKTFYVLHQNWFPIFCLLMAGMLLSWRLFAKPPYVDVGVKAAAVAMPPG